MRLIVTGFGAFQGVARNPTEQLIAHVERQDLERLLPGVDVELRVLRVAASAADAFASSVGGGGGDKQNDKPYSGALLIVHLGVDSRPNRPPTIALERCAYNECGFVAPDEDGRVLTRETACCGGGGEGGGGGDCVAAAPPPPLGARLETGLDLAALKRGLERRRGARGQSEYGVVVSEDAGRFLCNYVYARSLHECRRLGQEGQEGRGATAAAGAGAGDGAGAAPAPPRPRAEALFVHVPPFAVLPEAAQREALVDLLQELVAMVGSGGTAAAAATAVEAKPP